jgi:hypothetical protein
MGLGTLRTMQTQNHHPNLRPGDRDVWLERKAVSAAFALESARAAGIRMAIDGDDLVLEAPAQPPEAVISLLAHHKVDILRQLRRTENDWPPEDWQVFFDERAGIAEFDGGVGRAEAEARAFDCCVAEWINRHPTRLCRAGA